MEVVVTDDADKVAGLDMSSWTRCGGPAGSRAVVMTDHRSGQVMELLGADNQPPRDKGTNWNGYWVDSWTEPTGKGTRSGDS